MLVSKSSHRHKDVLGTGTEKGGVEGELTLLGEKLWRWWSQGVGRGPGTRKS